METTPIPNPTPSPSETETVDAEGLLRAYDVVICGTGLVQSIVACALARAGKAILHCDGNDYYGEMNAVWTYSMIQDMLRMQQEKNEAKDNSTTDDAILAHIMDGGGDDTVTATDTNTTLVPVGRQTSSKLKWSIPYCSSSSLFDDYEFYFGIKVGTEVNTKFGTGNLRSIRCNITVEIELNQWKFTNGQSPILYIPIADGSFMTSRNSIYSTTENDNTYTNNGNSDDVEIDAVLLERFLYRTNKIRSVQSIEAEYIFRKAKRWMALDAAPCFVLANGIAVRSMLTCGVANYLEFKPVDGLYWLDTKSKITRNNNNSSSSSSVDDDSYEISRVPCSKKDVFETKLLAPMDKRRFMKFIQLAMDYATAEIVATEEEDSQQGYHEDDQDSTINNEQSNDHDEPNCKDKQLLEGNDVRSLNERHLNQGRSLSRPQNKVVNTSELNRLKETIENDSIDFDNFLTQQHKLSKKLSSIVRYALAWETSGSSSGSTNSLSHGMRTLRKHLQALGRYGTTALLVPMYGSGELAQAFCRSAAVFGATYLLRRRPVAMQIRNTSDVKYVEGVVLLNDTDDSEERISENKKPVTKTIKCSHVVLPLDVSNDSIRCPSSSMCLITRRISILKGKVLPSDNGEQRHIIFIPPGTMGNSNAIHGVVLDDSVSVVPSGCTLIHLTSTVGFNDTKANEKKCNTNDVDSAALLQRAQASVLKSKLSAGASESPPVELYGVSFTHECPQLEKITTSSNHPPGVHFCQHTAQELTADAAFEQARIIFSNICPGEDFMELSDAINEVIRERRDDKRYDDEEKNMLDSAVNMIDIDTKV